MENDTESPSGVLTTEEYDDLPVQMRERVCDVHLVVKVANKFGHEVCIACVVEDAWRPPRDVDHEHEGPDASSREVGR